MSTLEIRTDRIIRNIEKLNIFLSRHNVQWTLVSKVLSGHRATLEKIVTHDAMSGVHSVGDARLSSLKTMKQIRPDLVTMYIKPPAIRNVESVVKYADISLNTYYKTIHALNDAARKQDKIHKIIIMVELGELREGIIRDHILNFYESVFELPNIEVIGLGTNLGCMYGVEPSFDKLIQLCLFEELIKAKFHTELPFISGGSSINLPFIARKKMPARVNHLRVGEAAFLGTSPYNNKKFKNLSVDAFEFRGEVIEFYRKENEPDGIISDAAIGHTAEEEIARSQTDNMSYKAVVDFGLLDVSIEDLTPKDKAVKFVGTTSDMTVFAVDVPKGKKPKYRVGGTIKFKLSYMGVARLMNSKFVTKRPV